MPGPDLAFWHDRFATGHTPWDRDGPSPQLAPWIDEGLFAPGVHVIVPGCGAGHEVPVLAACGCRVTAIDYTAAAVALTEAKLAASNERADVIEANVLRWTPLHPADIVYEQTCLCALHPDHWVPYARQLARWLRPGGRLAALFMQAHKNTAAQGWITGPPDHCDIHAMRALFTSQDWYWPTPPYEQVPHPVGVDALAVVLTRR